MTEKDKSDLIGCGIILVTIPAYFTHIITCLMAGNWGFLIAGAIAFPIAVIHGILIWIGVA